MDEREREHILRSALLLQEYENTPAVFNDPYSEMSDIEKSKLIIYLQELLEGQRRQAEELREAASREREALMAQLAQSNATNASLMELIRSLKDENAKLLEGQAQAESRMAELIKTNADMTEQLALGRKGRFGSRSQKGRKSKADREKSHQEDKDDFDGTNPPAVTIPPGSSLTRRRRAPTGSSWPTP